MIYLNNGTVGLLRINTVSTDNALWADSLEAWRAEMDELVAQCRAQEAEEATNGSD